MKTLFARQACQERDVEPAPKIVAMLRVKDAILFLEEWLENIVELVDEIVVVDNGSTDGTLDILKSHPMVAELRRTEGFHEGRDKILAYQLARSRNPEWVLWLDVDEVFERRLTRDRLVQMCSNNNCAAYTFRLFNFHLDYKHFEARMDKLVYMSIPSLRLWREDHNVFFRNSVIHNGQPQGIRGKIALSRFRIKHFGAVDREYLKRKTDIYLQIDSVHSDMYIRHRDQRLPVWPWYEWDENPAMVMVQNFILNLIYFFRRTSNYAQRAVRILSKS